MFNVLYRESASCFVKNGTFFFLTATSDSIGTFTNAVQLSGISLFISPTFTHCFINTHIFFIVALEYFVANASKYS